MVGEWSASFDTEPKYKLDEVMESIRNHKGDAPAGFLNRTMSEERKAFLTDFVQAQMVVYEAADRPSVSRGWFYWTLKTEFGAFAEWDFLRGFEEGWIPTLAPPLETSESLFGTCREIATQTSDDESIVEEFPNPKNHPELWYGPEIQDEYVLTHAGSRTKEGRLVDPKESSTTTTKSAAEGSTTGQGSGDSSPSSSSEPTKDSSEELTTHSGGFPVFFLGFFAWAIWKVYLRAPGRRQYRSVDNPTHLTV